MKKYSDKQKEEIVKLRKRGMKLKDIATLLEINNLTTIRNVCRDAGIPGKKYSPKVKYESGQRYGIFTLIKLSFNKKSKNDNIIPYWECKCDCGKTFFVATKHMRTRLKSCGCLSISNRFKNNDKTSLEIVGNYRLGHYKNASKRRLLSWDLPENKFIELLFSNCYYCKSPPLTLLKVKKHKLMVNGVDRVNNDLGYSINNCVACCKFCNRAKNNATLEDFTNWINRIKKYENRNNI